MFKCQYFFILFVLRNCTSGFANYISHRSIFAFKTQSIAMLFAMFCHAGGRVLP